VSKLIDFIDAKPDQNLLLRDILIKSKGYWGYSEEQLAIWRSNLVFEKKYISQNTVKLIIKESKIIGFFAITRNKVDLLDHLWLLPEAIGKGIGNLVFKQILKECNALGISEFFIISDPDAQGFYEKKGAKQVGEVYSEPQKRMLAKFNFQVV